MRFGTCCAIGAFLVAAGASPPLRALTVTLEECAEGADFIGNAARSRDNGIRAEEFLGRMEQDLVAIRSVPPAMRWFARDGDDEALLRVAALDVFAAPRGPEHHHREFLASCRATVAAAGGAPPLATR
jgi:hypothetical protein